MVLLRKGQVAKTLLGLMCFMSPSAVTQLTSDEVNSIFSVPHLKPSEHFKQTVLITKPLVVKVKFQ